MKVLDITAGLAGPFCSAWLADMGADVVKVEPTETGERTRGTLPLDSGWSPFFAACNRGKRDITLNLRHQEGQQIARSLASRADVLVSNFTPGVLDRLGLGYEQLRTDNPRLIWVNGSGYGSKGPKAGKGSVDLAAQAAGGLASVTGTRETGPLLAGASIADMTLALCLLSGVMTALYSRERTGLGDKVEASLVGGQLVLQSTEIAYHSVAPELSNPHGSGQGHYLFPPTYACYKTADGTIAVAGAGGLNWPAFCLALGRQDLTEDCRFRSPSQRKQHEAALRQELESVFITQTTAHWESVLEGLRVPSSPVRNYDEILSDEQCYLNGDLVKIADPHGVEVTFVGTPVKLDSCDIRPRSSSPELGQHTEEVLLELGYDWPGIGRLRESAVV
ncbi:MAG: CoA transferase [Dehalococcoidia bacterium]